MNNLASELMIKNKESIGNISVEIQGNESGIADIIKMILVRNDLEGLTEGL